MKKIFNYLLILSIVSFTSESCTSKKPISKVENTKKITKIPCSDFRTDKNYFRASASFKGPDLQFARENSAALSRAQLAANIKANIEATNNRFAEQRNIGGKVEFTQKATAQTDQIVVESVQFTSIVCEEVEQSSDGQYTVYSAVEVSQDVILNGVEKAMSSDEKLRQDFDAAQYRKIHNEKIEEYKNSRN
ncbi:MAG: hypothetical protein CL832_00515 [Crocinitomicaceae bacterium]|nr:hypothetical protein [Crocinitomicaceae bacterium]MAW82936.1 hypothetical protein [Crocinitomicaceae bacterium]|tara:strand:- start:4256 stop:4828 length:573 start_codon:yes stop_codon:yes gene_type:complete